LEALKMLKTLILAGAESPPITAKRQPPTAPPKLLNISIEGRA
jgi:hypothetical protein